MPPGSWGSLICIAWLPLLTVWSRASPRTVAIGGFGAWATAAGTGFAWVLTHALPTTALASAGGLLTWSFLFTLPWPLSAAVRRRWGALAGFVALVALHVTVEGLISRGPLAFPWGLLGHALSDTPWLRHLAALGGVGAVSMWIAAVNVLLFTAASRRSFRLPATALLALLVGGAILLGMQRTPGSTSSTSQFDGSDATRVLLVQPNTPPAHWADVRDTSRVRSLRHHTTRALDTTAASPDLIVWPETALPLPRSRVEQHSLYRALQKWVDSTGIPLLTGGVGSVDDHQPAASPDPTSSTSFTNRVWFFRPSGASGRRASRSPKTYDKVHLVPFAEHVPFSDRLTALEALRVPAGGVPGYVRGTGPSVWDTPLGRTTPLVCFESVTLPYVRSAARNGAEVFVTVAQTGWWDGPTGPRQHLAFSRLTALALGRPVIVASVKGPSAVVGPDGETIASSAYGTQSVLFAAVPSATSATPFLRFGDVPFFLAGVGSALAVIALWGRRLRGPIAAKTDS